MRQIRWERVVLLLLAAIAVIWLLCKILALVFAALGAVAIAILLPLLKGTFWAIDYSGPLLGGAVLGGAVGYLASLCFKRRSEKVQWVVGLLIMMLVVQVSVAYHMHVEKKLVAAQEVFDQGDIYRGLVMRNETLAANQSVLLGEWRTDGQGNAWYVWWPWAKYHDPEIKDFTPRPEW